MIAVYGNTGFWAWLRYWYLDSADFVTLMLMDKGYYDYDYERPKLKTQAARGAAKSDKELIEALSRMGFGTVVKEDDNKPITPDEMQRIAMAEARERKNKQ